MSEQVPLKRKVLIFSILVLILVVLPLGSWYYLSGGLKWRKQAQAELQDYGKIRSAMIIYADGTKEDLLAGKVCVVHYFGANPDLTAENQKALDVCERLFNQFGYKPGAQVDEFRMVMVSQGGTAEFKSYAQTLPSADFVNWVWTGGLGSWQTILFNSYDLYCQKNDIKPVDNYFALTDTSGTIRRFYNAMDEKELGRMVEHIALLLPYK
ncbi:MAG: hypothetical protein KDD14_01890 [Saprospiraceae bacterium]|nr:hypothetical protein [Saprospiraceae bacterium]